MVSSSIKYRKKITLWLISHKTRILLILFLYPNIVCFTPDSTDTSNTFIDFMLGIGKYADVTYNCEGQQTSVTKYSYFDYGAGFNHKIDIVNLGVRGGGFTINDAEYESTRYPYYQDDFTIPGYSTIYINPYIGLNTKYFESNWGVLFFSNTPLYNNKLSDYLSFDESNLQISADLRIGNKEAFHFSSQYLSNIPLLSGSLIDMGFGIGNEENRSLTWLGFSAGPFQNVGFALRQTQQITNNFDLLIKGRIGQIESNLEGSISLGARYNF